MAKQPLGGLIIHGFTSNIACVEPMGARLEKMGLPYEMPVLRGHSSTPDDLKRLVGADWQSDVAAAYNRIVDKAERVVVIGHSFGAMLTLDLAARNSRRAQIAGLALAAPYYGIVPRRNETIMPILFSVQKTFEMKADKAYADPQRAAHDPSYRVIPSSAAVESLKLVQQIRRPERLAQVTQPALIMSARHERVVDPQGGQIILDAIGSQEKELVWFERSGHEMFLDQEADAVLDRVEAFVRARLAVTA